MENPTDWRDFAGGHVHVQKDGRFIRTGFVKHVTVHGDALWVEADGSEPRALYERAQGHTVLPVTKPATVRRP